MRLKIAAWVLRLYIVVRGTLVSRYRQRGLGHRLQVNYGSGGLFSSYDVFYLAIFV
jgi:hypothetical protein